MYKYIRLIVIIIIIIIISCIRKECDVVKDRYYKFNDEQKEFLTNYSEGDTVKFKDINNNILKSSIVGKFFDYTTSGDSCGTVYFQYGVIDYSNCHLNDSIDLYATIYISMCKVPGGFIGMKCREYGFLMELYFNSDIYGKTAGSSFNNTDNFVCIYDSLEIDNHIYKNVYLYERDSTIIEGEYMDVYKIYYNLKSAKIFLSIFFSGFDNF